MAIAPMNTAPTPTTDQSTTDCRSNGLKSSHTGVSVPIVSTSEAAMHAQPIGDDHPQDTDDDAHRAASICHRHGAQRQPLAGGEFFRGALSWPQAARISRPRGVRTGEA